ncbi:hypothetical protein LMTR3_20345 [Bradyrhizobium sp. LMTR 3]|nr:hypothetical protein LMTR3_20345 [Bradyrhizobium sp. LMTR 3]
MPKRLLGGERAWPRLSFGHKAVERLVQERDETWWTRNQDEAISWCRSHKIALVGDVECIEGRLERIEADRLQHKQTTLRLICSRYIQHEPIVVPLKIVEIGQTIEELAWWQIWHAPANPTLHLGAYVYSDIEVVTEFQQCGRQVLIQNRVAIRCRRKQERSPKCREYPGAKENSCARNSVQNVQDRASA